MNINDVFNSENRFFSTMSKVWDVLMLNLLFILTVIIGVGPASTGLYYAMVKNVRRSRSYASTSFFHAFKTNFKQAFFLGLLQIALGAMLFYSYSFALSMDGSTFAGQAYFAGWFVCLFLYTSVCIYMYPLLSRFAWSNKQILKMSLYFSLKHLPTTVGILVMLVGLALAVYVFPPVILFGFGLYVFFKSLLMEKILKKYTPKPAEGEETTADLWYLE